MDYWQRVDIEVAVDAQSSTGAITKPTWIIHEEAIEARLLPVSLDESHEVWATPEEEAYEAHLRGSWTGLELGMRLDNGTDVYDIRRILTPPPFGEPTTILQCVRITP